MKIKTGCDLVHIKKFEKSMKRGGGAFLSNIFSPHELSNNPSIESLAGLFAAKESTKKAFEITSKNWKEIEITKNKSGKPSIKIDELQDIIMSSDISISHDGDYAIAVATFLLK
jgi:phosphopantetheine--protein transferase-like protein